MRYESEILYDLMKRDGLLNPSQEQLPYESELKEKYVDEVKGAYPKVTDYRPEWLNYNLGYYIPADFPIESLENVTSVTVNNVIPYAYKSAILKGQTLVNYFDFSEWGEQERITLVADGTSKRISLGKSSSIKANTKYLTIIPIYENTINHNFSVGGWDYYKNQPIITINDGTGIIKKIATTHETTDRFQKGAYMELWRENTSGQITFGKPMMIEYQEGMENWDIPFFEGMTSVKAPVLTTTGKNLLNHHVCNTRLGAVVKNITNNSITFTAPQTWAGLSWVCFLEPNQEYTVSFKTDLTTAQLRGYMRFPNTNTNATGGFHSFSFTTDSTGEIQFTIESTTASEADITVSDVQIEKGSAATSYEPFKSNILTVNEDVTLRGIGDVQDTLDCLTGEVVKRVGEVVLDGSESWSIIEVRKTNTTVFYSTVTREYAKKFDNMNAGGKVNCDKFSWSSVDLGKGGTDDIEGSYTAFDGNICIAIAKSRLTSDDTDGLKQYLQSNPTTIQYELETPVVKTVDLNNVNQDGVETTFRPFEGTMHIQTDGTPLKPLFSGEIPVEATTQNLASFVNLEGVERTVNEYVEEEIIGDDVDEQQLL